MKNSLLHPNDIVSAKSFSDSATPNTSQLNEDEHNKPTTPNTTISLSKRFIANSFIHALIPSSAYQQLKLPFPEDEHYLLNFESNYYVNDKNLSSIVAFSLSSKEYKEFQMNSNKNNQNNKDTVSLANESIGNSFFSY